MATSAVRVPDVLYLATTIAGSITEAANLTCCIAEFVAFISLSIPPALAHTVRFGLPSTQLLRPLAALSFRLGSEMKTLE